MEIQMSNKIFYYSIFFLLLLFPKVALSDYYDSQSLASAQCQTDKNELSKAVGIISTRCNNSSSTRTYSLEFKTNEVGKDSNLWYTNKIYEYLVDNSTNKYSTEDEAKKACNDHWSNNPNNITYSCDKKSDATSKYFIHDYSQEPTISGCIHNYRYGETEEPEPEKNTAPVVTIHDPKENLVRFSDKNITFLASSLDKEEGRLDHVMSWFEDENNESWGVFYRKTKKMLQGRYLLRVTVKDLEDLTGSATRRLVVVDPPVIAINSSIENGLFVKGKTATFFGDIDFKDDISTSIQWYVGETNPATGAQLQYRFDEVGSFQIKAEVLVHEREFSEEVSIRVVNPPIININSSIINGLFIKGNIAEFVGSVSFYNDISNSIQWYVGGDKVATTGTNLQYEFDEIGSFQIKAEVIVNGDSFSEEVTIRVVDLPEVIITTPELDQSLLIGEKILLHATATFDGNDISNSIQWKGSDIISHSFGNAEFMASEPGSKRIQVQVIQNGLYDVSVYYDYDVSTDDVEENLSDDDSCQGQMFVGDPINVQIGNLVERVIDYKSNGEFPLVVSRTYNSMSNRDGIFGAKWTSNFSSNLDIRSDIDISVLLPSSSSEVFEYSNSKWMSKNHNSVNSFEKLSSEYLYIEQSGKIYHYDLSGKLLKIVNANGYSHYYEYSGPKLSKIYDNSDREISFEYKDGLIDFITTPDGNIISYRYSMAANQKNNLKYVTYPQVLSGGSLTDSMIEYIYDDVRFPNRLTGLIDEEGQRVSSWKYDFRGRAIESKRGTGFETTKLDYSVPGYSTVTNAFGKNTTYKFESINGIVKTTSINGVASENCDSTVKSITYYDNGQIKTRTDNNGNLKYFEYNERGLNKLIEIYSSTRIKNTSYTNIPADQRTVTEWLPSYPAISKLIEDGLTTDYKYYDNNLIKSITHVSTKLVSNDGHIQTAFEDRIWLFTYEYYDDKRYSKKIIDGPRTDIQDITEFTYSPEGNITSISDVFNQTTQIGHIRSDTEQDYLVSSSGVRKDYDYNARGWLTDIVTSNDEQASSNEWRYYKNGKVKEWTKPSGNKEQYKYSTAGYLTDTIDNQGNYKVITPDLNGGWRSIIIKDKDDLEHFSTFRIPDELGRTLNLVGANGQKVKFTYDGNGNVERTETQISPTEVVVKEAKYDYLNRPLRISYPGLDAPASIVEYGYDANTLLSVTEKSAIDEAKKQTTLFAYNGFGDLLKEESDATGIEYKYYDMPDSLVTRSLNADGKTTSYLYDAGNRTTIIDYPGESSDITYSYVTNKSGQGNIDRVSNSQGSHDFDYDYLGNIISDKYDIDGESFQIEYQRNDYGQLETLQYPSGKSIKYHYNNLDQVVGLNEISDGRSRVLAYDAKYKPFGPMTEILLGDPTESTKSNYIYDKSYRLTKNDHWSEYIYSNANQVSYVFGELAHEGGIHYQYDKLNRLIDVDWNIDKSTLKPDTDGASPMKFQGVTYGYDGLSNLTTKTWRSYKENIVKEPSGSDLSTNALLAMTINIPNKNQIFSTEITDYRNSIAEQGTTSYSGIMRTDYDSNGNLEYRVTQGLLGEKNSDQYIYNDAERFVTFKRNSRTIASYQYDALGQRSQKTDLDGEKTKFHYLMSSPLLSESKNGKFVSDYVYLNGQLITLIDRRDRSKKPALFDENGIELDNEESQYVDARREGPKKYTAKARGDFELVTSLKANSFKNGLTDSTVMLSENDNRDNPFLWISQSGETKSIPLRIYSPEIILPFIKKKMVKINYIDSTGMVISKDLNTRSENVKIQRDGDSFRVSTSIDGSNWQEQFSEEINVDRSLIAAVGVTNARANTGRLNLEIYSDPIFFYRLDHIGTPKALTDEDGMMAWKSDLGPYGETILGEFQVTGNLDSSLRFPGQYGDSESGLNYNYFRDYDPSIGRYIQSDPIGLSGGLNTYGYVSGNPIMYSDPTGQCPWCVVGGVVGFGVGFALELYSEDGDFYSASLAGLSGGAAGALSGGLSVLASVSIAGAATATNEVYKSYRDCGDLSDFSFLNVGASVAGTYLGGKLVGPAAKGLSGIRVPGPGTSTQPLIPLGRLVPKSPHAGGGTQLTSVNHEIVNSGSAALFENIFPAGISAGLPAFGINN
jgi:RHS repeat-associated protein